MYIYIFIYTFACLQFETHLVLPEHLQQLIVSYSFRTRSRHPLLPLPLVKVNRLVNTACKIMRTPPLDVCCNRQTHCTRKLFLNSAALRAVFRQVAHFAKTPENVSAMCGPWGVKAAEDIPKRGFVCTVAGQVRILGGCNIFRAVECVSCSVLERTCMWLCGER